MTRALHRYAGAMALLVAGGVSGPAAEGALTYSYRVGATEALVWVGESVTVPVYLREVVTDGTSSLLAAGGGLFGAGFRVDRVSATETPAVLMGLSAGPEFTPSSPQPVSVTSGRLLEFNLAANVPPVDLGNGVREVLVGTFTVGVPLDPATVAGTTTFRVSDYDNYGASADLITGTGAVIDGPGGGSPAAAVFTVTSIPEPGVTVSGLIAGMALLKRRR
jgi:hypothetical protein